ncbi:MAG: arsenical pump rane protein [Acidimicrobiaceae bacterium]
MVVAAGGIVTACGAVLAAPTNARDAASQAWPPFTLVAALLAIGAAAHAAGLFDAAGRLLGRLGGSALLLLCAVLAVVATATVVLNLDTAAAFLTPVAVIAARRRGIREDAFLYGTLFMANAASLLLPGSNLTNLLVLGHEHVNGAVFASRMFPAWVAAVLVTAGFVIVWRRSDLRVERPIVEAEVPPRLSWAAVALVGAAAVPVVVLDSPSLAVLGVAVVGVVLALAGGHLQGRRLLEAVDPAVLIGLFGVAVALGTLARSWSAPNRLLESSNSGVTVVVAALGAVVVNNLPAAVLFTARPVVHPRALLLGLNLGPNLAVTGSLSAFVWIKAARTVGAEPDWRRVTRLGAMLVPLSLAAAAGALALFGGS